MILFFLPKFLFSTPETRCILTRKKVASLSRSPIPNTQNTHPPASVLAAHKHAAAPVLRGGANDDRWRVGCRIRRPGPHRLPNLPQPGGDDPVVLARAWVQRLHAQTRTRTRTLMHMRHTRAHAATARNDASSTLSLGVCNLFSPPRARAHTQIHQKSFKLTNTHAQPEWPSI